MSKRKNWENLKYGKIGNVKIGKIEKNEKMGN